MKFSSLVTQAFTAIYANKGRSFLTALGIVIGIASVIALIGIGTGAGNSIEDSVSEFSSNTVTIQGQEITEDEEEEESAAFGPGGGRGPGGPGGFGATAEPTLTTEDLASIADLSDIVIATSPEINESTKVTISEVSERLNLVGVSEEYGVIEEKELDIGRELTLEDIETEAKVAVVG